MQYRPWQSKPSLMCRGFTYVEAVIAAALMCAVLGAFVISLDGGVDVFVTAFAKGVVGSRVNNALDQLVEDLSEAGATAVTVCGDGLEYDLYAVAMPLFRDADGTFRVTSSDTPAVQGVVVYCPFETDRGVRQLRRYVFYDTSYVFPFEFHGSPPITDEFIHLRDSAGQTLTINRAEGNTTLPEGRAYQTLCPGLAAFAVEPGELTRLEISAACLTRKDIKLVEKGERYVGHRN